MIKDRIDIEVRVRYAETDKMGVAYYANYFVWFEIGRAELCRSRGFCYADLEALGFILVVTDAQCHYRNSARYDDLLVIRTHLKSINKRLITFAYQVLRKETGEVLAEGETRHLSIGPDGKPKSLPEKFVSQLSQ